MEHPLRVLMVMHLPGSIDLGGARVQLELAEVLRAHGCEVQILAREEILEGRHEGRLGVSPDAFAAAAIRRVRPIANDFDIIDAHQGNLPLSKQRLGFKGLIVARSVGLAPLYAQFAREAQRRWPADTKAHLLTRPVRRWRKRRFLQQVTATFDLSDVIIVPNKDEKTYLEQHLGVGGKTAVHPLGISEQRLGALRGFLSERTSAPARVAFIGDWSARKGAHDWPDIVARVRERVPEVSFAFLGTRAGPAEVARAVGVGADTVEVVPSYRSEQLGDLLDGTRVGALPSYIEGLGLGVLEKMAAGIPSVCYDVPGPRETMGQVDPRLLVPAGDTEAFAERLVELLALDDDAYRELSQRCRSVAERFSWRLIGRDTLETYQRALRTLAR